MFLIIHNVPHTLNNHTIAQLKELFIYENKKDEQIDVHL